MFRKTLGVGGLFLLLSSEAAWAVSCPSGTWHPLTNGSVANASDVMDNFNCLAPLDGPSFTSKVGIGTSSPSQTLTIYGATPSAFGATLQIVNPNYSNAVNITNTQDYWGLNLGSDPTSQSLGGYHGPLWTYVINVQNAPLVLGANNQPVETILGNGNVGIGTTTPSNLLTVSASNIPYVAINSDSGSNKRIGISLNSIGHQQFEIGTDILVNNSRNFYIYDGTVPQTRLLIDASGNVGIGTITPAGNLDIYGASNANGVGITGSNSANPSTIASISSTNTNVGLKLSAKGTENIYFNSNGATQMRVSNASGVTASDYLQVSGGDTTHAVIVAAQGADTNVGLWLQSHGTSPIYFANGGLIVAEVLPASTTANYLALQAANTTAPPILSAAGSDTNVGLRLATKGTGAVDIFTSTRQVRVNDTPSSVDYLTLTGSATTSKTVTIGSAGSDTNVSIAMTPQGTGSVVHNGPTVLNSLGSATMTGLCINAGLVSNCTSSIRYKEHVRDAPFGLKEVLAMRPVTFKWKGRDENDFGFIAEEMAKVDPSFATYKDGKIEGVKYPQLTAILVNAVKELKTANDNQTVALQKLRAENALLRSSNQHQSTTLENLQTQMNVLQREQREMMARLARN